MAPEPFDLFEKWNLICPTPQAKPLNPFCETINLSVLPYFGRQIIEIFSRRVQCASSLISNISAQSSKTTLQVQKEHQP